MPNTVRFYYEETIAFELTAVLAIVVVLIAAVITGGNTPSVSVAIIVFVLTEAILLFRSWRSWPKSVLRRAKS